MEFLKKSIKQKSNKNIFQNQKDTPRKITWSFLFDFLTLNMCLLFLIFHFFLLYKMCSKTKPKKYNVFVLLLLTFFFLRFYFGKKKSSHYKILYFSKIFFLFAFPLLCVLFICFRGLTKKVSLEFQNFLQEFNSLECS